ncbi:unnamed protein product [Rotaria socialis]|uniref:Integrator complex subunit 4/Protein SIEL C-terminal Ig-like domain-containing protein n=1 Tax=Rotaria socialis TaxID=392032 RepID=A0A817PZJ2_9BILA|nr:unnamed protein product [Rotaria socialis]CAF4485895.1 unnamed protein product [Rotaria socialis]
MATLKKRILQNISQAETISETTSQEPPITAIATLILDNKTRSIPTSAHKVRVVEYKTTYRRFTEFIKRLKTLKTLREYNEILAELTDRLVLYRNCIDDCAAILVQHLLDATDPLIQTAFLNTLKIVEQQYPTSSIKHSNELLNLGKQTKSIKVASALLSYFSILPMSSPVDKNALARFAIQYSTNTHVRIQLCAFKLLSTLGRVSDLEASLKTSIINKLLQAIEHDDARVRAEALRAMVDLFKCKVGLNSSYYSSFVECLQDYYAEVRLAACEALFLLGINTPDSIVPLGLSTDESSKLINEVFRLICDLTNDEAKIVRVQAMKMIGKLCRSGVDINLIHQTLDKKLLRITKKKAFIAKVEQLDSETDDITVHDVTVDAQSASITAIGPCGALISGLEDEYSDVRAAAIESCYEISCCYDAFQSKLVEYIVSMFDDDIEHVRLLAMRTLGKIARGRVLSGEQVLSILTELLSRSYDIRSALHDILRVVRIGDPDTLFKLFHRLVENIQRFKTDTYSVLRCLRELGQNNSAFIALLLPKLLPMHSYLDVQEPQFSKIDHTCALILVLNAALHHPSIVAVLPDYVFRHYRYLRTKEPELTPNLQTNFSDVKFEIDASLPITIPSSHDAFERILKLSEQSQDLHANDRQKFYRNLAAELHKVAEMDVDLLAISECISLYYEVLAIITYQCNTRTCLKALSICKRLLTMFHGYSEKQLLLFQELHLYCHLFLISIQTKLSTNARQRCYKHIQWQREQLKNAGEQQQQQQQEMDEKLLHTNLISYAQQYISVMSKNILSNKTNMFKANNLIKMVSVTFLEPESNIEHVLEFLPGLSVSIPCLMNGKNLSRQQNINIKVTYLDGQYCLLPINDDNIRTLAEDNSLRIDSKVTFSHQHWLRPCYATFSVVLFPLRSQCFVMDINDEFVEITRPIRVLLHPKYLRHRLRKKHSIDEQSTMSATTVEQLDIAEDDNDEPETEWLDEAGVDEEETGHMDDDESEMDTSQDDEQVEYVERRKTPDSDEDEEMSY